MTELVRSSMRLRPDRVVVGEGAAPGPGSHQVWGTGHPGGIATIHAGSALARCCALEQLILEVAVNPPCADRGSGQRGHPHRRARAQAPSKPSPASSASMAWVTPGGCAEVRRFPSCRCSPAPAASLPVTTLENCHDAR